jgi:beta-glucosidase
VAAADLSDGATNRWFLDPLFRGVYPRDVEELFDAHGARVAEVIGETDLAAISAAIDFLGMNYYFRRRVRASPGGLGWSDVAPGTEAGENEMGWSIDPTGLTEQLVRLRDEYRSPAVVVTENGIALRDEPGPSGYVDDQGRIAYLRDHLAAVAAAIDAGVDVRGYFVWSLLDNFEWAYGYRPRFGLVRVDYETQSRTPKASAAWYRRVIEANDVVE